MATTTNYGWETPDDTDLVKDGAAAIRTLGSSVDTTTKNLNPQTTTGALAYRSATANVNTALPIGSTGQVLTVAGGVPSWAAAAGGSSYSGCSVYKSANQSVTNATSTAITFNTEDFDTDAYHSTSTNTSRFTVPAGKAGKFLITGTVVFSANTTGVRDAVIYKNGSVYNYGTSLQTVESGTYGTYLPLSFVLNLAVNDYVEIFAFQASGTSLDVIGGIDSTNVQFNFLGA